MSFINLMVWKSTLLAVSLGAVGADVSEASAEAYRGLVSIRRVVIRDSVRTLAKEGGPQALAALEALRAGRLRRDETGSPWMLIEDSGHAVNLLTGGEVSGSSLKLERPVINNLIRRALRPALAKLRLRSDDRRVRLAAANELNKRPTSMVIPAVKEALLAEEDDTVVNVLLLVLAQEQLKSNVSEERVAAIGLIGDSGSLVLKPRIEELVEKNDDGNYLEKDAVVVKAALEVLGSLERKELVVTQIGNLFYGISLGSILMLAALGLAITFGLMGVINMAHGEMLMLGAYSTYFMQTVFARHLPDLFDYYILAAIPFAFLVTTFIGVVLEQTVIKHLYGRPLETLLATWGISLVLIQVVRLVFGAQNVEVTNPSWLSSGFEAEHGLVLPYNRIAIVVFSLLVVILVWILIKKTSVGLRVRAVTQNRNMASCMGINVSKVDMWTFGFGSGIAGLGGTALSQVGNVGPELGQSYIVDSFMVVVLGGVGEITGTVVGAFGLGVINKFLEPLTGAVLGKILVLFFIILFIQKRPQGIFALKGRTRENQSA